ncbi:hypothetical protein HanXRQr2_Chr13g0588171 [Helianthus annuus]|uniref:Uncharacterized protein n=1 Tax=Helianthus annuus TaxID=4232 RepID=A0A251SSN2_HELAN|nr:hypothetical protein HanXRQr2_Chr13g0588171 [Helianthus annuus]KAJ0848162.1 hypothetical protein HanPSC8_Chr13g0553921 [Helianthus annuus]
MVKILNFSQWCKGCKWNHLHSNCCLCYNLPMWSMRDVSLQSSRKKLELTGAGVFLRRQPEAPIEPVEK